MEPERKKLEKVVTGEVKQRKKSKLASVFAAEDLSRVFAYLATDVLVPKIKDIISGMITNGIDMLLYGEGSRSKNNSERVSYQNCYKRPSERGLETRSRDVYAYEDFTLPTRGEADNVLRLMREQLAEYGIVSVSDFYDLIGVRATFADCKYGWTDLRMAYVDRVHEGYVIRFPKIGEL